MKMMLLAAAGSLAVIGLAAAPAQAQQTYIRGFSDAPSARSADSRFSSNGFFVRGGSGWSESDHRSCMDRDHCRRRGGGRSDVILESYGGEWALYNNRTFDSDSYNDWWHDRPDRSMPRWLTHNEGCARMWYAGDTLRC